MIEYNLSEGVCVLRLDSPPVNAISFDLLKELRAGVRRAAEDGECRGIIVTGSSRHFSAGADLGIFRKIRTREEAVRTSRLFQEAFQEVEDCPKPVVGAIAGNVMGSALELALSCHVRVCARGSTFGMPEVRFAINPGGGGTQRLPRLVGPGTALRMLLAAETVPDGEALKLGLVDAICEDDRLMQCARDVLVRTTEGRGTRNRTEKVSDPVALTDALRQAERIASEAPPGVLAPWKILEAVRAGLEGSFEEGLLREQSGFAECMDTSAARNRIYLFFATRGAGKLDGEVRAGAQEVRRAAVVGMGSMGTGIAQGLIEHGIPVTLLDEDESAVTRGVGRIRSSLEKQVDAGKQTRDRMDALLELLDPVESWQDLAGADLVIEAVFENADVKRAVIHRLEDVCPESTVIASNTSTINLDGLARGMQCPERLIGMHFFNPAHRMPLVEVVRRNDTPQRVAATALQLARAMHKTPVLVKNREGFLVNRVFIPYLKEAFWLLEEGADPGAVDAAMVDFGFPMGPLTLIDMAGLDVLLLTDGVLSRAFPEHGPLSLLVSRLVERGHLGQKSGSGVYAYERGSRATLRNEEAEQLIHEVRQGSGREPRGFEAEEITVRLVLRMVNEAFRVLEEGIARSESDLDVAMVLGTGFPDWRGGVIRYARDLGPGRVVMELERLAGECGQRFHPCRLLREMEGVR